MGRYRVHGIMIREREKKYLPKEPSGLQIMIASILAGFAGVGLVGILFPVSC